MKEVKVYLPTALAQNVIFLALKSITTPRNKMAKFGRRDWLKRLALFSTMNKSSFTARGAARIQRRAVYLRELEKAVAVSEVFSGVPKEYSGKSLGLLPSQIRTWNRSGTGSLNTVPTFCEIDTATAFLNASECFPILARGHPIRTTVVIQSETWLLHKHCWFVCIFFLLPLFSREVRDDPNKLISRGPMFDFGSTPRCRTNCPFRFHTVEHTEKTSRCFI